MRKQIRHWQEAEGEMDLVPAVSASFSGSYFSTSLVFLAKTGGMKVKAACEELSPGWLLPCISHSRPRPPNLGHTLPSELLFAMGCDHNLSDSIWRKKVHSQCLLINCLCVRKNKWNLGWDTSKGDLKKIYAVGTSVSISSLCRLGRSAPQLLRNLFFITILLFFFGGGMLRRQPWESVLSVHDGLWESNSVKLPRQAQLPTESSCLAFLKTF